MWGIMRQNRRQGLDRLCRLRGLNFILRTMEKALNSFNQGFEKAYPSNSYWFLILLFLIQQFILYIFPFFSHIIFKGGVYTSVTWLLKLYVLSSEHLVHIIGNFLMVISQGENFQVNRYTHFIRLLLILYFHSSRSDVYYHQQVVRVPNSPTLAKHLIFLPILYKKNYILALL